MTLNELRAYHNEIYKILSKERAMRAKVFPPGHKDREAKLREMDRALEILERLKNELKPHCPDVQQGELLPLPRKSASRAKNTIPDFRLTPSNSASSEIALRWATVFCARRIRIPR